MKQLEGISKSISISPMMEQYQQQFALMSKGITTPISDQFRLIQESIQESFNPFIKSISDQQAFLQQQIQIPELMAQRISEWQSIIGNINYPAILEATVPEDICISLGELLESQMESSSNLSANITVGPRAQLENDEIKWITFQPLLIFILTLIITSCFNHANNIRQGIQHQELMAESKHQTELTEQIVTIEKERLKNEQDAVELKDIEDKFDVLMKSIKPLILENPNASESDQ